ncbi:MAG: hypothetical protein KA132_11440, partial [Thauera sp.]|nr:hypothetical protein [Thauera sp.]
AAAIRASAESDQAAAVEAVPTFGGNNLAGADSAAADPDDEVAARCQLPWPVGVNYPGRWKRGMMGLAFRL